MQGRPMKIGSLFAATLAKASEADVLLFSDNAKYMAINKRDSTLTVADRLARNAKFAGTNFHCVFETANRAYDRIIFLSDSRAGSVMTLRLKRSRLTRRSTGRSTGLLIRSARVWDVTVPRAEHLLPGRLFR